MPTDPDGPGKEPNLELPSLGFGRKRKRARKSEPAPDAPEASSDAEPVEPTVAPTPPPAPPSAPASAPATGPTPARPAARPPSRPAARPPSRPAGAPTAGATPARPAARPPSRPTTPAPESEPAVIDPLDTASAALDEPREARASKRKTRKAEKAQEAAQEIEESGPSASEALVARLPAINPVYAAIIVGLLSGLAAVLLAFGAGRGCDAIRGTESCGGGIGLIALVAILALEVLIGAALLKAWRIADPYSTSFLGVGVVAMIAMLLFLDSIDSPWMLLVIPLMTAASFALSWWITVRFIDEYDEDAG